MYDKKQATKLKHHLELLKKIAWQQSACEVVLHEQNAHALADGMLKQDWRTWPTIGKDFAWGTPSGHHWFAGELVVPKTGASITPYLKLIAKNEILLGRTDPQCQVWLDGKLCQAFDGYHRELFLPSTMQAGDNAIIHINAYTAEIERQLGIGLVWFEQHDDAASLYYDLSISFEAAVRLNENDARRHNMFNLIDKSLNTLDMRARDDAFSASVKLALEIAQGIFEGDQKGSASTLSLVGHTHIDVAWLWPISQTREKMVRSMSTACKLMDEYPEFIFMYNQCILFEWLKEDAPELFERIKVHVKSGQFEIEGAMWLEPDVNLISGESLVRQITRGMAFQQKEFGITPRVLWLPDTFGYTAAIPQLMAQSGLDIFVTSKCSWNDANRMPYDTFEWQGIDGTSVTAFLITAQTDDKGERGDHRTDYGPHLDVSSAVGAWNRYEPKALNQNVLVPYGHGDGGGGPCRVMLENAKRMQKGVPGLPQVKLEGITPYFDRLRETISQSEKKFPRWVGELYFEYHRGTLTSLAKNKRHNANGEHMLRELELLAVLAKLDGHDVAQASMEIDALWKILQLNQFHDILPGTSIPQVYADSDSDYADMFARGKSLYEKLAPMALGKNLLLNGIGTKRKNSLVQFEPNNDVVAVSIGEEALILQKAHRADGSFSFTAPVEHMAPTAQLDVVACEKAADEIVELSIDEHHLENAHLRILINQNGEVTSIFDKLTRREVLNAGTVGNQLRVYEDKPLNWDAWDIDWYYEEKSWPLGQPAIVEVIETGPHRAALRIERKYNNSKITQIVSLAANARQVEFDFYADWQESQSLLKAEFDFDVTTDHIKSQIQFGHVSRPTHRNTSWDEARFEASMHRWVAFEEAEFSIGVLNDCKYGYGARDTQMGVTLIKSGIYPHPSADREEHLCRYAITINDGPNLVEKINRQAMDFATPLVFKGDLKSSSARAKQALISWDAENVVLHAAKLADHSEDVVFRLCEEAGKRTRVNIQMDKRFGNVRIINLLEQDIASCVPNQMDSIEIELKPFQIITLAAALK